MAMFRRKKGSFKADPTNLEVLASAKPEHSLGNKHGKMGRHLVFPTDR